MPLVTVEKTKKYLVLRIPLGAVEQKKAEISSAGQRIIDEAIKKGLSNIKAGKTFGPFRSVREFKQALRSTTKR